MIVIVTVVKEIIHIENHTLYFWLLIFNFGCFSYLIYRPTYINTYVDFLVVLRKQNTKKQDIKFLKFQSQIPEHDDFMIALEWINTVKEYPNNIDQFVDHVIHLSSIQHQHEHHHLHLHQKHPQQHILPPKCSNVIITIQQQQQ